MSGDGGKYVNLGDCGSHKGRKGKQAREKSITEILANRVTKSQEEHSAETGGDVGSSQEISEVSEVSEIPEIPENKEKQTKPYTKKSKKNGSKNGNAGKGTKNKQNQITMVGAEETGESIQFAGGEETGESIQFAGGEEKAREFYEIPQKAINVRFDGAKRLIASNYEIKEKQPLMREMAESAKDIWQSAARGKKELQIQGLVPKLDSFNLNQP